MKLFLIFALLFSFSCSSNKKSVLADQFIKDFAEINNLDKTKCTDGDSKSCSQFFKGQYILKGYEKTQTENKKICQEGKKIFCYGVGYIDYFHGHIEKGISTIKENCDKGDSWSCYFLAAMTFESDRIAGSNQYKTYLNRGCELGESKSCLLLLQVDHKNLTSKQYRKWEKKILTKDHSKMDVIQFVHQNYDTNKNLAQKTLLNECKNSSQDACYYLESKKVSGEDRYNQFREISIRNCQEGSPLACTHLCSQEIKSGNYESAYRYCRNGCLKSQPSSCHYLAHISEKIGNINDSIFYSRLGCIAGDIDSCHSLSYYFEKRGLNEEAKIPLKVICHSGRVYGCNRLITILASENKIKDSERYAKKSCSLKNGLGCYSYAVKQHKEKKKKDASTYFSKACDLRNQQGCLGLCLISAEKGDKKEASGYLIKACEFSTSKECEKYRNKKVEDLNLQASELKKLCHYDQSKPWWYWASIIGISVLGAQSLNL